MNRVLSPPAEGFAVDTPVLIIGAGACGLIAALACHDAGVDCVILERDRVPSGSTALSAGLIPAAGTRFQTERGVRDSPALLAADIQRKAKGRADPQIVAAVVNAVGPTLEWLVDQHGLVLDLLEDFLYPGHSTLRMHGAPARSGADLIAMLQRAVDQAGIPIVTQAKVEILFVDVTGHLRGAGYRRPDGELETIGCQAVILACNGYGGATDLVAQHIPEMAAALYFGHAGNQGDALRWGEDLGAEAVHLTAYQGHGSVAHPHGVLITWATVMNGGFQVNSAGRRFSDETHGYSEQAVAVLAQPGGIAWTIFDESIATTARQFQDFRDAEAVGAIVTAPDLATLAERTGLPTLALNASLAEIVDGKCPWGRAKTEALRAPYCAVRVTGALFHTQGGLRIDVTARVLRKDGSALPNLFAGGGAACGVSGPSVDGYLSGNGLLTAVALGRIAGAGAAKLVSS
jgi:fumarate reductase flavoprotein subunit